MRIAQDWRPRDTLSAPRVPQRTPLPVANGRAEYPHFSRGLQRDRVCAFFCGILRPGPAYPRRIPLFGKPALPTILLLACSNMFMTTAWYWHLRGGPQVAEARPIWMVIGISWGLALFEYCLAVPANRIGFAHGWSAGQLKVAQEAIALVIFGGFMVFVLGEALTWRHLAAFACLMGAVAFLFSGR